jgi:hypothetical protein
MMSDIEIAPKTGTTLRTVQYTGQVICDFPVWARKSLSKLNDGTLILHRRSGSQAVYLTEWLVKAPDSADILCYSNDELWKAYERVIP